MSKTASQEKKAKKVLIVEDEGDMCLLLNILLNGKEMELDHVKNLTAAGEYGIGRGMDKKDGRIEYTPGYFK